MTEDPRIGALPDSHGHAKGEHKAFADERPIPYTARMLFLWFYHACRRGAPRFMMVADHINYLTFEDPAAVHVVRRALKLAQAGDLYGAAETAGVELGHASVVSEGLRKGMRYSIGAEVDNDPRSRPDAQNIVDAMKPDGLVRSVHFLPIAHPQHGENWMWAFDNPEFKEFFEIVGTERVWEIYMETLLDAIEKLPGHIVGHFYVPAKFGHWPDEAVLEGYEDRLVDACAERGMAIEINSRYLYKYYVGDEEQLERFRSAHLRLMRKAKAKSVMIAVGSDAHSPRDQGGAFEAILALLDEADVNEIAFPLNDRLARVALRATEEILRQHNAALAAPANARARALVPSEPGEDDEDGNEPSAPESAQDRAEIILPPEAPQPDSDAADVEASVLEAAAAVKAPPRVRKSRAKPKVVAEPESSVASPMVDAPVAAQPDPVEPPVVETPVAETPVVETPAATAPAAAAAKPPKRGAAPKPAVAAVAPKPVVTIKPKPPAKTKVVPAAPPAPPVKAPAKAAPAAKAATKKPAAKKAAPARPTKKKKAAPVKKAAALKKPAPKKAVAKKAAPAKKGPAKKAPAKKAVAKKAAPARKSAPAKRPAPKKATPKRPAAKKTAKKKSTRR